MSDTSKTQPAVERVGLRVESVAGVLHEVMRFLDRKPAAARGGDLPAAARRLIQWRAATLGDRPGAEQDRRVVPVS